MSSFSNYTENGVLNHLFKAVNFPSPSLYMGLFQSDAGLESNEIASAAEVVDASSYARVNINDFGGFSTSVAGQTSNTQDLDFNVALTDWGTVTHTAILDAATGGNVIAWGPLTNPRTLYAGDALKVRAGACVISLS